MTQSLFHESLADALLVGLLFGALMELRREWYAIERLIGIA